MAIIDFADRRSEQFAPGGFVKEFGAFARQAEKKLDMLDAATSLRDLAAIRGNRLESLSADRRGQYSIRINDRWRVCFSWPEAQVGPSGVEIVDHY